MYAIYVYDTRADFGGWLSGVQPNSRLFSGGTRMEEPEYVPILVNTSIRRRTWSDKKEVVRYARELSKKIEKPQVRPTMYYSRSGLRYRITVRDVFVNAVVFELR